MIELNVIEEFLRLKKDKSLFHRESRDLEFKEQFNLSSLGEYLRDFAALANNIGGYLIFGVSDSPRRLVGLKKKSIMQFEKIDPEMITNFLLEIFSSEIRWEQKLIEIGKKQFGIFYISESLQKPIIAKKNEGRDQIIKNGEIYYRYAGRTQKIQYSELDYMIEQRIKGINQEWMSLMNKIAKIGPSSVAILDTDKGIIEKNDNQILVIDEQLVKKINFVKEGSFCQKNGTQALKLIGDVKPIESVEVIKTVQRKVIDQYPLSCKELMIKIKKLLPDIGQNVVYKAIKENGIKGDSRYSVYNFRCKEHEEEYKKDGKIRSATPVIYNNAALEFLIKVLA